PPFEDARVRRAFILLFDAEWINRSLFDGAYKRTQSFFERSELSSHGRPADARERALLAPFAQYIKPEVLGGTASLPLTDGGGAAPARAPRQSCAGAPGPRPRAAGPERAGLPLPAGVRPNPRQQERVMLSFGRTLERLGIGLRIRHVDTPQYWARLKTFDFDM